MSLYPKIFLRGCSSSVPNFMLVSPKAHFFNISAGLIGHVKDPTAPTQTEKWNVHCLTY
jgi:hypothetical protein